MSGLNIAGVTFKASGQERNDQKRNTLATGIAAASIAGTAVAANAIAKYAGNRPEGFVAKTGRAVQTPFSYLSGKYAEKVAPKLGTFLAENAVGKKLAVAGSFVAKQAKSLQTYVKNLPTPVKVVAGLAAASIAVGHIFKSGVISGFYAGQQSDK